MTLIAWNDLLTGLDGLPTEQHLRHVPVSTNSMSTINGISRMVTISKFPQASDLDRRSILRQSALVTFGTY